MPRRLKNIFRSGKEDKERKNEAAKSQPLKKPFFSVTEWSGGIDWRCYGCRNLQTTIFAEIHRTAQTRPVMFHESFEELSQCASGDEGCRPCRVFRRAFLLRQPAPGDEINLFRSEYTGSVEASLLKDGDSLFLKLSLQNASSHKDTAYVSCTESRKLEHPKIRFDPNEVTHETVRNWLTTCQRSHRCHEAAWSPENPTRLLHILSETSVQLEVTAGKPFKKYVALSYCWGDEIAPDNEKVIIQEGKTTRAKFDSRCSQPFSTSSLPSIIKDAIAFTKRIGIDYIWCDTLAIIQQDEADWQQEAGRMHMVYGNAALTICASSSIKATDQLLRSRSAWRTQAVGCELGRYQMYNLDEDLHDAVGNSPHAQRGWTMQEDILSPRNIYWFGQAVYWSCEECQWIEGVNDSKNRPPPLRLQAQSSVNSDRTEATSRGFLSTTREGNDEERLAEWFAVVAAYSRRTLTKAYNRYDAISGVAARYIYFQQYDQRLGNDRYLAGLWYHGFAEQLVWSVEKPADKTAREWDELRTLTSTWSWLSLPFQTPVKMRHRDQVETFELSTEGLPAERSRKELDQSPEEAIRVGGTKFEIKVRGRFRAFMSGESKLVAWNDIRSTGEQSVSTYNVSAFLGTDIYFADSASGVIGAVERRRQPMTGQLDYRQDAERIECGLLRRIYCIEVCADAMLLLEAVDEPKTRFKRIGVSFEYWKGFFDESKQEDVYLC